MIGPGRIFEFTGKFPGNWNNGVKMVAKLTLFSSPTNIPAFSGRISVFSPFTRAGNYVLFLVVSVFILFFITSMFYSVLRRILEKKNDEDSDSEYREYAEEEHWEEVIKKIQMAIFFFGVLGAITAYFLSYKALHSIKVDALGNPMRIHLPEYSPEILTADTLLTLGILGVFWAWTRLYQVLLIRNIMGRYRNLVRIIPLLSLFMILSFTVGLWYFYSNVFPLWWHVFSFGIIYGIIYFFGMKDFKAKLQSYLTSQIDYEDRYTLRSTSIGMGTILILGISIPLITYKTVPISYIFVLFFSVWLVSILMSTGKLFREVKIFPRISTASSRLLFFTHYTRKFFVAWLIILGIIGGVLGAAVVFDPGFADPYKNVSACGENLKKIGGALDKYMENNNNWLPGSSQWAKESWLLKTDGDLKKMPKCPAGGKYVYKKWRDEEHRPVYEIRCSCSAHRRAGIKDTYPRYRRFEGIIYSPKPEKDKEGKKETTQ